MAEALADERHDVLVVEGVEHHPAFAPGPDQAQGPQEPQLVRHGRLGEAEQRGQVADAEFVSRQGVQDSDAGRVAQGSEGLGQGDDVTGADQTGAHPLDPRRVGDEHVAGVRIMCDGAAFEGVGAHRPLVCIYEHLFIYKTITSPAGQSNRAVVNGLSGHCLPAESGQWVSLKFRVGNGD